MLCERCGENEANVQLQAFSLDGQSRTLHLCSSCLERQKEEMGREGADFAELMGALFGRIAQRVKSEDAKQPTCPGCGRKYAEVRSTHMLGCAQCYGAFREKIEEFLLKRNDSARYVNASTDAVESRRQRIRKLRGEMKAAIETENYEQAAQLRDEIQALERRG